MAVPSPPSCRTLCLAFHLQVGNQDMAIRCFQRAIDLRDPEGVALHLLVRCAELG
jgi:hypothetical protein